MSSKIKLKFSQLTKSRVNHRDHHTEMDSPVLQQQNEFLSANTSTQAAGTPKSNWQIPQYVLDDLCRYDVSLFAKIMILLLAWDFWHCVTVQLSMKIMIILKPESVSYLTAAVMILAGQINVQQSQ